MEQFRDFQDPLEEIGVQAVNHCPVTIHRQTDQNDIAEILLKVALTQYFSNNNWM
jgi:hypothetical protein